MSEGSAVTITTVRAGDLLKVRALQRKAFQAHLSYGIGTLSLLWAIPGAAFLVARRDDAIVGCAIGDRSGDISRVISLAVDPAARRQGIGERLMHALEQALPDGDMILMVQEENLAAQSLYEKVGYRHVGVARDYYGKGQDGLWMRKVRTRSGSERLFV